MQISDNTAENSVVDRKKWSIGTKMLLALVVVIGASTLGYGIFTMQENIVGPFKIANLGSVNKDLQIPSAASKDLEAAALKKKDTDGDGLSDYDEINLYGTSPYLADTDSDGILDGVEVKNGTDPNCQQGQDCRGIRLVTPDTKISDLFPQFSTSTISLKDKTISDFRQILLNQGFDPAKLAQIDDRTLLIILEESLTIQDQSATTTATSTPQQPVNLDQVRQLLVDMGVPQDEVNSMSNQDVENLLKTLK